MDEIIWNNLKIIMLSNNNNQILLVHSLLVNVASFCIFWKLFEKMRKLFIKEFFVIMFQKMITR